MGCQKPHPRSFEPRSAVYEPKDITFGVSDSRKRDKSPGERLFAGIWIMEGGGIAVSSSPAYWRPERDEATCQTIIPTISPSTDIHTAPATT